MGLQGHKALVKAQSSATGFTDEATTTADNQNYVVADTAKRIFPLSATIVVEDAGVPTTEDYTLSRLASNDINVTFDSVDGGRVITITGEYVTLTTIATANGYSFVAAADSLDNTPFSEVGFREFTPGLISATAELTRFYVADEFFVDTILSGDINVIEYYPQFDQDPFRFFGLLISNTADGAVDGLVNESMSYQVTTEFNFGS